MFNFSHRKWYPKYSIKYWNKKYSFSQHSLKLSSKWYKGFLINHEKTKPLPVGYEEAAKLAGTKLRVENDAYDIAGNLVLDCIAIYLEEASKQVLFWQYLSQIRKNPKISLVIEKFMTSPTKTAEIAETRCGCDITILMRSGCLCSGI